MLSLRGGDEPLTWPHLLHCQLSLIQMNGWFPWQPPHRSHLIEPRHPQFWQKVSYSITRMSSTRFKVVFPLQDGHFMEDDVFRLLIHLPQNKFNFILRPFYRSLRARTSASTIKVFLFFISTDSVVFSVILEELRGINSPCLEQVYQGLKNGVFRKMGIINSFKILEEVR